MMVRLIKYFAAIIFIILFTSSSFPQNTENVNTEFKLAVNLYDALQYNDALKIFNRIASTEKINSKTTVSYIFKAKTLLKLDRFEEAKQTLIKMIELFPSKQV